MRIKKSENAQLAQNADETFMIKFAGHSSSAIFKEEIQLPHNHTNYKYMYLGVDLSRSIS